MNDWISVNDKLPTEHELFLTCDSYNNIAIVVFMPFDNGFLEDDITHWMPLPEPPK